MVYRQTASYPFKFLLQQRVSSGYCSSGHLWKILSSWLEEGVCIYDVSKGADVLVLAPVMNIFCDNLRALELINHLENSATKFCRVCLVKIWLICTYFVQL